MSGDAWDAKIRVDPRVAAALGVSVEEIKLMSLRELANRAYDAGFTWEVSTTRSKNAEGHLTIRMEAPDFLNADA